MRPLAQCAILLAVCLLPSTLPAQQPEIEIGIDGGLEYAFDPNLLTIAVPFQRVRAAFPFEHRLAFEPSLSLTRLSAEGESAVLMVMHFGILYDIEAQRNTTYARPFAGLEYADASFAESETVFNLGAGMGTRTRIAEQLAVRIEASLTGRFDTEGGTDAVIGVTVGLSFFTR